MKKNYLIFCISCILFASNLFAEFSDASKHSKSKIQGENFQAQEFVFGFHPAWEDEYGINNCFKIFVTAEVVTEVRVTIPYFSNQSIIVQTAKPNELLEIKLTPEQALPYRRDSAASKESLLPTQVWQGRGIIVTANNPITCYGFADYYNQSEGFAALPVYKLGKSYIISSYRENSNFSTQALNPYVDIIGVYDKTKVSFFFGGNNNSRIRTVDDSVWKPFDILRADLNRGDMWLIASEGSFSDLGGSMVLASKPVSVLSGNHSGSIPTGVGRHNYLIEQEIPTIAWGQKYFVTPIANRTYSSLIRTFCAESPATFYRDGVEALTLFSNWGKEDEGWHEMRANPEGNLPTVWNSDKPINIVQYNTGEGDHGIIQEPFQMNMVSEEQFSNSIIFIVPGNSSDLLFAANYLNIIYQSISADIPEDLLVGLYLESGEILWKKVQELALSAGEMFKDKERFGEEIQLYTATIPLDSPGKYILSCESSKIGVNLYGFGDNTSYGIGILKSIDLINKADTMPPVPYYKLLCDGSTSDKSTLVVDFPEEDSIRSNMALIIFNKQTSYNFTFSYDDFIPGEDRSVKWSLRVQDLLQKAHAEITFTDRAGNDTTIYVDFPGQCTFAINPNSGGFGIMDIGESKTLTFEIENVGTTPIYLNDINFQSIRENFESQGFELEYNFDLPILMQTNEKLPFEVKFTATKKGTFQDSVGVGDSCIFRYFAGVKAIVNTVGISKNDMNDTEISIIPNPATDIINIDLGNYILQGVDEGHSISIFDVLGEKVMTIETRSNESLQNFDVSSLLPGVYFVRIGEVVQKFMKM